MSMPILEETGTDVNPDLFDQLLDDINNVRTHIVNPPANTHIWKPGMDMREVVEFARAFGLEITALCGYVFVPKRDPDKYDACEKCMEIAGELMRGMGE